jgi:hypothetical protein
LTGYGSGGSLQQMALAAAALAPQVEQAFVTGQQTAHRAQGDGVAASKEVFQAGRGWRRQRQHQLRLGAHDASPYSVLAR